jgi:formylglycine-generating enzyme required for sulfatase activity
MELGQVKNKYAPIQHPELDSQNDGALHERRTDRSNRRSNRMNKWISWSVIACIGGYVGCGGKYPGDEKIARNEEGSPALAMAPFDRREAQAFQQAWSDHLGCEREVVNSIQMRFALIPAGEFVMGSPPTEANRNADEGPQHQVRITRPFFFGIFEVTQDEYERVMGTNPSHFGPQGTMTRFVDTVGRARFPVEAVSWEDAIEFCRQLSELPGERAASRVYRLPSEAEWEFACRAGTETPFHYGGRLTGAEAKFNANFPYGTRRVVYLPYGPTDVGSYSANSFGLHDMHGSVWEWCADWYDPNYYTDSPLDDPTGPTEGKYRVIRGGGWDYGAGVCRAASRYRRPPGFRYSLLGFRVAFDVAIEEGATAQENASDRSE